MHTFGDFMLLFIAMLLLALLMIAAFQHRSKSKWFCDKMGWHNAPVVTGWDGASFEGVCPRCGRHVLQDSQGNWFSLEGR